MTTTMNVIAFVPRARTAAASIEPGRRPARTIQIGNDSDRVANARGECDERERRRDVWRDAEYRLDYLRALRTLGLAASAAFRRGLDEAKRYVDLDEGFELPARCRAAELELLLTPAPTVAALNQKKSMRASDWCSGIVNANEQAIDTIIARDEAWLKANAPVRRKAAALS